MMKEYLITLLSGVLALVSCYKEEIPAIMDKGGIQAPNAAYDLVINYPVPPEGATDVKKGWTSGDMVYLFFEGESGGYVFLTYEGSSWGFPSMHGHVTFTLSGKTLTAVYLPFRQGSDPVPTYHDGAWHFSTIRYAYYMRAEKVPYTTTSSVDATKVSATINMESPDGYGDITITSTVTSVTAVKGTGNAPDSIGIGEAGACGTITIGGVVTGRIHDSPYTYHP